MVRVTDSLLPQIAADLGVTVGATSIVVTAYLLAHGSVQLVIGPIGDRAGKYRTIAFATAGSAVMVAICGLAPSLPILIGARLGSGLATGWIIPLALAFVGDVIPYERRQQVIGRFLSGQILGQLFGQAAGGVLGDLFGWRNVFFALAGLFALAAAGLIFELIIDPRTRAGRSAAMPRSFAGGYMAVLANPFARMILIVGFLEGGVAWGPFTYIGANLHSRFGLSFTLIGLSVACFGIGGLFYASLVRHFVYWLGQTGLIVIGGLVIATAYVLLSFESIWWLAPIAATAIGLGFYMFHNTLQTKATQMTPQARGTAVAFFTSALYFGQTAGVAAGAFVIDHLGAMPLFLGTAVAFPTLAIWFAYELRRAQQQS
jgi:MFS transporter, YNFM family, putative membrane transport protein